MSRHQQYWDTFYAGHDSDGVPRAPSPFAEWVADRVGPGTPVVELGFGTARDSLWFARRGHPVRAYDFAPSAVEAARRTAERSDLDARFETLDLYDPHACDEVARAVAGLSDPPLVYARFLVHALEEDGRENLFRLAADGLAEGGFLALEYRTDADRGQRHLFGDDHFREFLSPSLVLDQLHGRGATVIEAVEGHGLAVYKDEDPHIARVLATFHPGPAAPSGEERS